MTSQPSDAGRYEALNLAHGASESDPFTVERYKQFYRHLPAGAIDVLDVGCNTGRGGQTLFELDAALRIVGIDVVRDRIERLPSHYVDGLVARTDHIPVADDSFDAVVAGEVIEHLYSTDLSPTLAEFFRVLRLGGRLLLTTPNPNGAKRRILRESVLGGPHVSQHFPRTLRMQLRATGFSRVRLRGSGKATRYLHELAPLAAFGSYLTMADKR